MALAHENLNMVVPPEVKENFYRVLRIYQTKYPHGKVYTFLNEAVKNFEEKLTMKYPI